MEPAAQLKFLQSIVESIKDSQAMVDMLEEFDVTWEMVRLVPMCFAELPVSARTECGILYFNKALLKGDEKAALERISPYMVHELTHHFQQTCGTQATQGSDADDYLDNKFEIEGFQNQSKFISEEHGEPAAERYIEQVLDHHEVGGKERERRLEQLLELANKK